MLLRICCQITHALKQKDCFYTRRENESKSTCGIKIFSFKLAEKLREWKKAASVQREGFLSLTLFRKKLCTRIQLMLQTPVVHTLLLSVRVASTSVTDRIWPIKVIMIIATSMASFMLHYVKWWCNNLHESLSYSMCYISPYLYNVWWPLCFTSFSTVKLIFSIHYLIYVTADIKCLNVTWAEHLRHSTVLCERLRYHKIMATIN